MAKFLNAIFEDFGPEVMQRLRQQVDERLTEAVLEERIDGIRKAVSAMGEANIDKNTIIALLQKYWDLRLSEANMYTDSLED